MKFTERFFEFPIKIYDSLSLDRVTTIVDNIDNQEDIGEEDWVRGIAKLPYRALLDIYYYDMFSIGRKTGDVAEEGFDLTTIYHPEYGEFECTWKRSTFEKNLNAFVETYEKYLEEQLVLAVKNHSGI